MVVPQFAPEWTVDMVQALPEDGQRYEIIDGELYVSPVPRREQQYAVMDGGPPRILSQPGSRFDTVAV